MCTKFSISIVLFVFFLGVSCTKNSKSSANEHLQENVSMELEKFDTIVLLAPDTLGGKPLMHAMQMRKSDREFAHDNLSLKHLSEILWAANGINRNTLKRTVPSALALYPIQTYVFLSNGIYFYNVQRHLLEPVVQGDMRHLTGTQAFVKTAPLNLVFVADFKAYEGDSKVPEDKRLWLASLDAGHSAQNVYLYCASEGLKCVVRGAVNENELLEILGLRNKFHFIVAQTVGY